MLKILSFVCNEHTCLLSVEAAFSPRLPTKFDLGFGIADLFKEESNKFLLTGNSAG
ncbi:MAG TPA: hypothetical protein VIL74_06385 [Pyrinomonadaceae bacterium]